jgi:antirestriction protein
MATLEEVMEAAEDDGLEVDAVAAHYDNNSHYYATESVEDILESFTDSYQGEHPCGADYAEECYNGMGADLGELSHYIDWERVWKDMQYEGTWSENAPTGGVFIFIPV